jgi:titin
LFQLGTEPPGEPLSVGILKKMKDSVILDWLFPVDNGGSPITEYEIEIWDNTTAAWKFQGSTPAADIGPHCACPHTLASTSYTVTGLKQDHQYLFRVYAKNSIGRSKPAETSTLAAPKKPEG